MTGVAVVIPARDEERSLPELLESLLAQTRPPDEIVVCDAGSRDGTPEVARAAASRGVRLVEAGPAYPGRARNLAVAAATQPWIAFIDGGLEELSKGLRKRAKRVVRGIERGAGGGRCGRDAEERVHLCVLAEEFDRCV